MISMVDDLILLNYIDSGCFAEIYLSKKQDSDTLLATKKISLKYISVEPLFKTSLENEINFMKEMDHPNIIKLYEVKLKPDNIYLVMEYCNGGSLKKALNIYKSKYGKPFTEEIVKYLMRQILSAVDYLHTHGIIHRDLKLENILLKHDNNYNIVDDDLNIFSSQIKIIDFNISTKSRKIPKDRELILDDDYEDNNYNEKIDIWYLGLLCYEMLFGEKMFGEEDKNIRISEQLYIIIPQRISLEAQTFLLSMLQTNANKRLSAKELLKHDFLKKEKNLSLELDDINEVKNLINSSAKNLNKVDKSNIAKKIGIRHINLNFNTNTPMNRSRYKTIMQEENKLRLSARLSKPTHKKMQTIISDNINNNSANINNSKPMIGPQLKKGGNNIKNINSLKNIYNVNKVVNNKNINNNKANVNANKKITNEHVCRILNVGKNFNNSQFKIIVDTCIKACLLIKGKNLTAEKAAKDIKKSLGDNWLVFISNVNSKNYDFCISVGKKDDHASFSFDDKLFHVFKYN